jgi:phosphoribosyl 1,2-cyclic phosphodiesterase
MRIHFCGVRGSTPAPGRPFLRYGGHTSSLALAHDDSSPTLIVDAGTGLRNVTNLLSGEPYRGTILLSHLHWDHVHGLPFFHAGQQEGHRVDVRLPSPDDDALATLARGLSPPHCPVTPTELGDGWTFERLDVGSYAVEGFEVTVREIPHKGGQTFGFRISDDTATVAYLGDHWPLALGPGPDGLGERHRAASELAAGADVLVHDAQFLAAEFPEVSYLGHASAEYAVALANEAAARHLVLFHHAPERTDAEIDTIVAGCAKSTVPIRAAAEGDVICLRDRILTSGR